MRVIETEIPEVKRVVPIRHGDARGWFSETFRADLLAASGIACDFVQDNQSFSVPKGTIRGLHFQLRPAAQAKLVRVLTAEQRAEQFDRTAPHYVELAGRHRASLAAR